MDTLPTDILLHIFKQMRYDEVMKLLIVNKTLNNFIKKNSKYMEFSCVHYNFKKTNIDDIIQLFPKIKLHIDGRKYDNYLDYINNTSDLILFSSKNKLIDVSLIKNVSALNISLSDNIININSLKDKDCKIESLTCCYNMIEDVSPFINIKNLRLYHSYNLKSLYPFKNGTYDEINLSSCSNLKDISPLKNCNIKKIILSYTPIEDVSYISHIDNIILTGCINIKDFSYLSNVEKLNISSTLIEDIDCLKNNRILEISKCENIKNINSLVNNKRLEILDLSHTYINNIPILPSVQILKK